MFKLKHLILTCLLLQSCGGKPPVYFEKSSFNALDNWSNQNFVNVQEAFNKNCKVISRKKALHKNKLFGDVNKWRNLCSQFKNISQNQVQQFFENKFNVYEVKSEEKSLFTGYYTPIIKGSLTKTDRFNVPLYKKPNNIYTGDLGLFYPELKGKKIIARVDERTKKIKPYYTRAEIEGLYKTLKPVLWLESKTDNFFLHIQGSGYVELPDKKVIHVAYNGSNGHKYKAIGRTLVQNGWMKKEDITMQSLYRWLQNNPNKQQQVFNTNPRFIFFREASGVTKGSLGVELKPQQALAVDPSYIPLGIPVFLETSLTYDNKPFKKVMYTEDTGAAIKGGVRGDIFFGKGKKAELYAGAQNNSGNLFVFVPK